jgi:prepilin-type processing-associated H-X9-DG protein
MLAQLDQGSHFHAANLTMSHNEALALLANHTVATTTVSLFLCPSDRTVPVPGYGRVTYRFDAGPTAWISPGPSMPRVASGPFTMHEFRTVAQMGDGLSNIVGASERIQGDWTSDRFDRGGDYRLADFGLTVVDTDDGERLINRCHAIASTFPAESRGGESWFFSGYHFTAYNHCQPPNPRTDDCSFDFATEPLHNRTIHSGTFPPRSRHPGGVNALFMDGHVGFLRDGIEVSVWKALATRDGGEVISADVIGP